MVWAGIMYNDRTTLHIFEQGTVASQLYYREIILDHVHLFRRSVSPYFVFMDDNVCPRRAAEVSDTLERENFEPMEWRAY